MEVDIERWIEFISGLLTMAMPQAMPAWNVCHAYARITSDGCWLRTHKQGERGRGRDDSDSTRLDRSTTFYFQVFRSMVFALPFLSEFALHVTTDHLMFDSPNWFISPSIFSCGNTLTLWTFASFFFLPTLCHRLEVGTWLFSLNHLYAAK